MSKKVEIKNPDAPMTYGQAMKIAMIFYKESKMTVAKASEFIEQLENKFNGKKAEPKAETETKVEPKQQQETSAIEAKKPEPKAEEPKAKNDGVLKATLEPLEEEPEEQSEEPEKGEPKEVGGIVYKTTGFQKGDKFQKAEYFIKPDKVVVKSKGKEKEFGKESVEYKVILRVMLEKVEEDRKASHEALEKCRLKLEGVDKGFNEQKAKIEQALAN